MCKNSHETLLSLYGSPVEGSQDHENDYTLHCLPNIWVMWEHHIGAIQGQTRLLQCTKITSVQQVPLPDFTLFRCYFHSVTQPRLSESGDAPDDLLNVSDIQTHKHLPCSQQSWGCPACMRLMHCDTEARHSVAPQWCILGAIHAAACDAVQHVS